MYLGFEQERLVTIAEIATAHGISENHLMKVVHQLARSGYIETVRGKGGGMRLARAPGDIVLGAVIRETEADFAMVECFAAESSCRILSACRLRGILGDALNAMLKVVDSYTLADLLGKPQEHSQAITWSEKTPAAADVAANGRDGTTPDRSLL